MIVRFYTEAKKLHVYISINFVWQSYWLRNRLIFYTVSVFLFSSFIVVTATPY